MATTRAQSPSATGEQRTKRLISGLKLEHGLYPRHSVDSYHVKQLTEALRAGADFPAVVVEKATGRVVDGFHRISAVREVYGGEALIEALERVYECEEDLFLDAVRLNAGHGRRLAPYDQARCAAIGQRLSVDRSRLADALSVRPAAVDQLSAERFGSELSTRSPIPLKRTIQHMRGKSLSKAQIEANNKLGGHAQSYYANQLILLLENDLLDVENEKLLRRVAKLKGLVGDLEDRLGADLEDYLQEQAANREVS